MKCALVTGGSRGIGKAVCSKMAQMGYHVLINYNNNAAEAEHTLSLVRESGGDGEILQFDVADKTQVDTAISSWTSSNMDKSIQILINNAGINDDSLMIWMEDPQWFNVINTILHGFYHVTQSVLPGMLTERYGRIVNVVSLSGLRGTKGQVNYSAAKAGVIGATKALALETGQSGVTVNAVAPGFIRTDMTERLDENEIKMEIPLKRFGTSDEVAHAVGFLASPEAAYITGEVLSINGGLYT